MLASGQAFFLLACLAAVVALSMAAIRRKQALNRRCVRVLHLCDMHLLSTKEGRACETTTFDNASRTIDQAMRQHHDAPPDLVVLGGDQSDDGSIGSYKLAIQLIKRFGRPVFAVPGNHDNRSNQAAVFKEHPTLVEEQQEARYGNWQILIVDSTLAVAKGRISVEELARISSCLARNPKQNICLCLHHHPISVGIEWLDGIGVENASALIDLLGRHSKQVVVLFGHVHMEVAVEQNGILFLSAPSTAWQVVKDSCPPEEGANLPGYRWIELHSDGTVTTSVDRLGA